MRTLLLAPHFDDEVLFTSFTILRHDPDIAWVFAPPTLKEHETRLKESMTALAWLWKDGPPVDWQRHVTSGFAVEGDGVAELLGQFLAGASDKYQRLFAPAPYEDGHTEHNSVGYAAVASGVPTVLYDTYGRTRGRVHGGTEVVPEWQWIQPKLAALSCFTSQIEHPQRRPWFYDMLDMREWLS
jgi:LmbE family N-acetylglucosaminyl deacetylase